MKLTRKYVVTRIVKPVLRGHLWDK